MKLLLLGLTVVAAVGASPYMKYGEKDWMIIPGSDGKAHLALLTHPNMKPRVDDPYTEITFYLYTRSNRDSPQQIWVGNINGAPFQPNKPTKFVIHGFSDNGFTEWAIGLKNNFLDVEDCNVILVDWSGPAAAPLYNEAKANVRPTGEYVGQMHDYLSSLGHPVSNTHCIGHSLGSHVCGFSGKSTTAGTLRRVTGMDPALPLFTFDDVAERLSDTDAAYVDVIHTCGSWLGFERAIGHADFYPNGGSFVQPGCINDITGACSHGRAHEFFSESIKSESFIAYECASWEDFQNNFCYGNTIGIMGNPSTSDTRGSFYLTTSDRSPFALG